MKNILVIGFLCLLFSCTGKKGNDFTITGRVPEGIESVSLMFSDGMTKAVTVDTVKNGVFTLKYATDCPIPFALSIGKTGQYVYLFVYPGDRQEVSISADSVVFAGDGADNNQALRLLSEKNREMNKNSNFDIRDVEGYANNTRDKTLRLMAYLDELGIKDQLFVRAKKEELRLRMYNSLIGLPGSLKFFTGRDTIFSESYYVFLKEIKLDAPELVNVDFINSFLRDYFEAMETNGFLNPGLTDYLAKRAELIANPVVRENYILRALALEHYGYNQYFNEVVASVAPFVVSEKGKETLENQKLAQRELQQQYARFNAGAPAFDFVGTDRTGKTYSLSDFKGKVVVVDVWNTACVPCIAQIPYLKKLEHYFEGQDVVFVSYALETDHDKWIKFLDAREMSGIQLIEPLGFKSDFAREYAIRGIPRFMVIDREGRIVDAFTPRPSDPRLKGLIKQTLGQ